VHTQRLAEMQPECVVKQREINLCRKMHEGREVVRHAVCVEKAVEFSQVAMVASNNVGRIHTNESVTVVALSHVPKTEVLGDQVQHLSELKYT